MKINLSFEKMVASLRKAIQTFPDKRTGNNVTYSLDDAALGAFSVFFTQCPSFLVYQKAMEDAKGKSNAQTIFQMERIPTDNHIRDLLDPVSCELVFPVFDDIFHGLNKSGYLDIFRVFNGDLLIHFDGTQYFSSKKIHCAQCSTKEHKDGSITYFHSMITPVIAAPGIDKVIALKPEFIVPQDGHEKQDCENAAFKRWIDKYGKEYSQLGITATADDLYSKQPICEKTLANGFNFIFVCKEDSHPTLYEWVEALEEGKDRHTVTIRRWNGRFREIYTYKYANNVPLRDSDDTLLVNWFNITVTKEEGEILYNNSFITSHKIRDNNVENLAICARSHWKIENENNNTLKTKGYNLEHNYGHGKQNLSCLLASFIILAFLFHTVLEIMDSKYRLIRKHLPRRDTFFHDIRALTKYLCFDSWTHLMDFMMEGLELKLEPGYT
jgi:hypothetical protein